MIGLLVSLGVLLFAAAGGVCHIWLHRAKLAPKPPQSADPALGAAEGTDIEVEP